MHPPPFPPPPVIRWAVYPTTVGSGPACLPFSDSLSKQRKVERSVSDGTREKERRTERKRLLLSRVCGLEYAIFGCLLHVLLFITTKLLRHCFTLSLNSSPVNFPIMLGKLLLIHNFTRRWSQQQLNRPVIVLRWSQQPGILSFKTLHDIIYASVFS